MILIGSRALLNNVDFTSKSNEKAKEMARRYFNADYDVIMSVEDFDIWVKKYQDYIVKLKPNGSNKYKAIVNFGGHKQYEIELGFEGSSAKYLLDHIDEVTDLSDYDVFTQKYRTLKLSYQMLTKRSHLVYPVHFEKNIEDYHFIREMLTKEGYDFEQKDDVAEEYFRLRSAEAKERYKKFKTPKLNVSTEDFFSSKLAVEHFFVHDHIHEIVAHHDSPVYTFTQPDSTSAWCSKKLFDELPYDMKIQMVQEEAYAIALERYIIPKADENWIAYFYCYQRAVKRICTTLTSGWFRDFAIENYPVVIDRYNHYFVDKFAKAYEEGRIKTIDGKEWSLDA